MRLLLITITISLIIIALLRCSDATKRECPGNILVDNCFRRSVLITGGNRGIGLATAEALVRGGDHHVTAVCERDDGECERALERLNETRNCNPNIEINKEVIDFARLAEVQRFLERIRDDHYPRGIYDVIVLNAAVFDNTSKTEDGYDALFQVNFLAQYMLVRELARLRAIYLSGSPPSNLVTLTSMLYDKIGTGEGAPYGIQEPLDPSPENWPKMFNSASELHTYAGLKRPWRAYALSKLAMAILAVQLNGTRVGNNAEKGEILAVTVDPGWTRTVIGGGVDVDPDRQAIRRQLGQQEPEEAAESVLYGIRQVQEPLKHRSTANTYELLPGQYRKGKENVLLAEIATNPQNGKNLIEMADKMIEKFKRGRK